MYGISAARPSSRAALNAAAIRAGPVASGIDPLECRQRLVEVLVTAPGQADQVGAARIVAFVEQPGDRMGGLERRDDPLESRQLAESAQRLLVGDRDVSGP